MVLGLRTKSESLSTSAVHLPSRHPWLDHRDTSTFARKGATASSNFRIFCHESSPPKAVKFSGTLPQHRFLLEPCHKTLQRASINARLPFTPCQEPGIERDVGSNRIEPRHTHRRLSKAVWESCLLSPHALHVSCHGIALVTPLQRLAAGGFGG